MTSVQTTIALPADVYAALSANGYMGERLKEAFRLHLAAGLFRNRLLSLEKASELAGIGMWEFTDFLGNLDIPVIDHDDEEITREIVTAEWLTKKVKNESNS